MEAYRIIIKPLHAFTDTSTTPDLPSRRLITNPENANWWRHLYRFRFAYKISMNLLRFAIDLWVIEVQIYGGLTVNLRSTDQWRKRGELLTSSETLQNTGHHDDSIGSHRKWRQYVAASVFASYLNSCWAIVSISFLVHHILAGRGPMFCTAETSPQF